jgi:1-acyl-sn-glycerol-3-phosphate acyltransferase
MSLILINDKTEQTRAQKMMGAERRQNDARDHAIGRILSQYEELDPSDRARVRHEILRRAGQDELERHIKAAATQEAFFSAPPAPDRDTTELFSDQLIQYFQDARRTAAKYLPRDQYKKGDQDNLNLIRHETLHTLEPIEWMMKKYFRYEVRGLENVPRKGPAIIISNHGILPIDGWFLFYEIYRATGRWPRGMTDWRIYKFPWLRQLFMDMGMVVGTHKNGDRLLQKGEMIFIMPGGSKEAWKSSKYRYRLLWQGRKGFIRMALRNAIPIIPSANVGTDDTYHVFFDGYTTAYKLFRSKRALLPISIPIGLGLLPRPVKMTQYVGRMIRLPYPPEAETDPSVVEECQELVKSKVYELIDLGLREREERSLNVIVRR